MRSVYKYESIPMILGDLAVFAISLWLSLLIRYVSVPDVSQFVEHCRVFLPLFIIWLGFFWIGGLYSKHIRFSRSKLPSKILFAQFTNIGMAFIYFYLFQSSVIVSGITPKTILVVYLIISTLLFTLWRIFLYPKLSNIRSIRVAFIGKNSETNVFKNAEDRLRKSGIEIAYIGEGTDFKQIPTLDGVDIIVFNSYDAQGNSHIASLYDLVFKGVTFIDFADFYEEVFEMVPLNSIDENWFLRHVSVAKRPIYDSLKRLMDIIIALPLAIVSLVFYPFVYIARKIEGLGPIFIFQNRIGEMGKPVRIVKFGSMTVDDDGKWVTKSDNRITPVGKFLRKSRIDELPQLWNVLRGDLSLIGPRPELPNLVELYKKEIPYYHARHLIKPGLSGWAQVHHDIPPHSIEETRTKLAYDLYYIKNRGLLLDLNIAFATVKTLLSRTGI